MTDTQRHTGSCFCGAVEIAATGAPFTMGYCHCKDCRSWNAAPVNAYTLWKTDQVEVTKGHDSLASFSANGSSERNFCEKCGGGLFVRIPAHDMIDIFAAILPTLPYKAEVHVNYASTVLRMQDGLPKFSDFPAEAGGSGEMLPE